MSCSRRHFISSSGPSYILELETVGSEHCGLHSPLQRHSGHSHQGSVTPLCICGFPSAGSHHRGALACLSPLLPACLHLQGSRGSPTLHPVSLSSPRHSASPPHFALDLSFNFIRPLLVSCPSSSQDPLCSALFQSSSHPGNRPWPSGQ